MHPKTEKSLSEHTGVTPVTQDSAGLHTTGNISLKSVSVSLRPFAEDPGLKEPLV